MKKSIVYFLLCFSFSLSYAQEWQSLPNAPFSGRFDDIFFINENTGWAADGPGGSIYKTTDAGNSWELQFNEFSYFRNIEFLNENVGFLGTLENSFYRTTDGGDTWGIVNMSPYPEAICGIDAVGESTVYGVGAYFSPAHMIKSTDGGQTFTFTDMFSYADGLVEVEFVDEMHGYTSGRANSGGVILETFDGGVTWTEIFNSGNPGEYVWKLQLRDNGTHIFGSIESNNQGKLIKSFDSGATWVTKNFPDPSVQGIGFVSDTRGWMGGHNSGFYETNDGGDTWEDIGLGFTLNRFFFINDDVAYCSGETIYRFDREIILDVPEQEVNQTKDLEVIIAPNPVQDILTVSLGFTHIDNVLIELYDINGKLIKRLMRDKIPAAETRSYSFPFTYAAGTYFLDIHTNNGRRSKKFVKH